MSFGIGLMIVGKIVDKQEWFGEKFGKALMIGGAIAAIGGFDPFSATEAAVPVSESATALGSEGGLLAETSPLPEVSIDSGTALAGESTMASDALLMGDSSMARSMAAEEAMLAGNISPGVDLYSSPGVMGGGAGEGLLPEEGFFSGMSDTAKMGTMMVGGQVLGGYAQARKMEEMEKKKREEAERLRLNQTRWGQRTGGGGVKLNLGAGLTEMNNRFFSGRDRTRGLLT